MYYFLQICMQKLKNILILTHKVQQLVWIAAGKALAMTARPSKLISHRAEVSALIRLALAGCASPLRSKFLTGAPICHCETFSRYVIVSERSERDNPHDNLSANKKNFIILCCIIDKLKF